MKSHLRPLFLGLLLAAFAATTAGCSESAPRYGQYADVKQDWDSPRPDDVEDQLRNRLAHTQRDS